MHDEAIRDLLRQLHTKLERATSVADEDREQLRQLSADIQALLAQPGAATHPRHESLMGRLQEAISRFEVSHPDLTATMAQVSQSLSDMGI